MIGVDDVIGCDGDDNCHYDDDSVLRSTYHD